MTAASRVPPVAGIAGALGVLCFPPHACRLRTRRMPASADVTHAVRAVLFAVDPAVIVPLDARGAWW